MTIVDYAQVVAAEYMPVFKRPKLGDEAARHISNELPITPQTQIPQSDPATLTGAEKRLCPNNHYGVGT